MFQKFKRIVIAISSLVLLLVSAACSEKQNDSLHSMIDSSISANSPAESSFIEDNILNGSSSSSTATGNPEADAAIATFGHMGEEYLLHSRHFQQGETRTEETASLGWDGDMLLCVKSGEIVDYSPNPDERDPIKKQWSAYAADFTDPCVLKLLLSLKNKNAEYKNGIRYQFGADMFRLAAYEDLIPENIQNAEFYTMVGDRMGAYEVAFDQHGEGDDYYRFDLQPGESFDFTLEFMVERNYFQQACPFLGVGNGRQLKAGVLLDHLNRE